MLKGGQTVSIPDTRLAFWIRVELDLPGNADITAAAMLKLTELSASRGISDLTGLEHATNLQSLRLLDGNQISNLQPIANLNKLEELWLFDNQISNVQPIANLTNLRDLLLGGNRISNLQPIANLNKLERLSLEGNQISSVQPIANLTKLQLLDLSNNQISNLQPIANLNKLWDLRLVDNQIRDVTPLAQLVNLEILYLKGNPIEDTTPLANLKLRKVDIEIKKAAPEPTPPPNLQEPTPQVVPEPTPPPNLQEPTPQVVPEPTPPPNLQEPTPPPDLAISNFRVSKTTLTAGERFTLFATVENRGGNLSNTKHFEFLYSPTKDVNPSDADIVAGGVIEPLAANGRTEMSASVSAPLQAGTYYYSACTGFIPNEENLNNNCSPWVGVTVLARLTDLVIPNVRVSKTTVAPGEQFTLFATVENRGRNRSNSAILQIAESRTTDVNPSAASGTDVGTIEPLAANGRIEVSASITARPRPGTYYYSACAVLVRDEENSSNNCSPWVRVTVVAPVTAPQPVAAQKEVTPEPPALVISNIRLSKATLAPGEQFTLIATVENRGTGQSAATTLQFQRATNTSYTQIGTRSVSALSANRVVEVSQSFTAPASEGIYHYRAYIQSVNKHSEWVSITVVAPVTAPQVVTPESPDLVVSDLRLSKTILAPGEQFTLFATVENRGTGQSAATTLQFQRDVNFTSYTRIGRSSITALSGNRVVEVSQSFTAPASAGIYQYRAYIESVSNERDSTNNYSEWVNITVVAPIPTKVVGTTHGHPPIYWTDGVAIQSWDGSNIHDLIPGYGFFSYDIAVDIASGKMYWLALHEVWEIRCADLDGSNMRTLVTGLEEPRSFALDVSGGKMYWTTMDPNVMTRERANGKIQCANLDGSNVRTLATGLAVSSDIALDVSGGKMYWTSLTGANRKIRYANLDGSNVQDLVTGLMHPSDIALDVLNGKIYWTSGSILNPATGGGMPGGKIQRANLDGSNIQALVTGIASSRDIALDVLGGKMYWADGVDGKIWYANLDGSNVQDLVTRKRVKDIALGIPPVTPVVRTPTPTPTPTPTVSEPSRITISGSATRRGAIVNQPLDAPLLVRVLDGNGKGVADVRVIFRVISGGGKVSERGKGQSVDSRTDRSGYAQADLTPLEDGTITVRASAAGITQTVEFTITARVAPTPRTPDTPKTVGTTHPHPPIYWTARGIGKIQSWDGLNVRDIATGLDFLESIAVDVVNGKVYWQQGSKLQSADLDGSNVTDIVTVNGPARIALDVANGKIYWIIGGSKIRRANLDGSNVTDIVPEWKGYARDIALDVAGGKICWTLKQGNVHKIQCANLDGSNVRNIVTGLDSLGDIALDVAGGKVYWTSWGKWSAATETREPDKIWSADLDGSNVTDIATGPDLGSIGDIALDVAGGKMYWDIHGLLEDSGGDRNTHEIQSADLDGSNVTDIVTGVEEISYIALGIPPQTAGISRTKTTQVSVDAGDRPPMYWIDTDAGTLHRLVDTEVENIAPSVRNATSLTIDVANNKLYWTEKTSNTTGKIRRANLDGTNVQLVLDLTSVPLDMTLDAANGKLYLTNSWGKVQRLNLDGSGFQPNLVTGLDTPTGIVVDVVGQKLYWTEKTSNTTGKIWRANLDGTNVTLVRDLTSVPLDMTLDAADNKLYLTNSSGNVQRLNLDDLGFQPRFIFIAGLAPMGIAVDTVGQQLYVTSPNGKIIRQGLNGVGYQEVVTGLRNPGALVLGGATTPTKTTTGIVTTRPPPSIYWIAGRTIQYLDGANVRDLVTGLDSLWGIAVDIAGGKMYWTSTTRAGGKIQCANLDGSNVQDLVTGEDYYPEDIALDVSGGKMYWTSLTGVDIGKVQCANLDGSNVQDLVVRKNYYPEDIALDVSGGKMYWTEGGGGKIGGKIQCANLDGSNVRDLVVRKNYSPRNIALDVSGGKMYWSDLAENSENRIQCADLDGSNATDLIIGLALPLDIALDVSGGKMYWVDEMHGKIRYANLDGSNRQPVVSGLDSPSRIALGIPLENTGGESRTQATQVSGDRPEDVNQDGKVDNVDMEMVAAALFGGNPPATPGRLDVNGDGALTIDDLTQVSNNLDEDEAAAPALGVQRNALAREKIQAAIDRLLATDDGSIGVQRTLAYLQTLLAAARPDETQLLANYPNPFNPETWLPYALAIDSDVTLTIYDASGKVIRRLVLGYQSAGYYTSRSRAAYWDGRNAQGERVASGVYFYTLTTGDFTATRKLLILK